MTHIILAFFKASKKGTIVFQGTLEAAQQFQWSTKNAADLRSQGYTDWQLAPAKER